MLPSGSLLVRRALAAVLVAPILVLGVACGDDGAPDEAPTTSVGTDPGADGEDDGVADTPDAGPDGSVDQERPDTDLPPPADD